jgi:hypothetical protein
MNNKFQKLAVVLSIVGIVFSCTTDKTESITPDSQTKTIENTTTQARATTTKKFLFDAIKAENAGNADWIISENSSGTPLRFPNPSISTVTASTPETYWQGGLSAWGIALVKQGHTVESIVSGGRITYGDASNAQDLSNYDVYVVDEPNILFTSSEKTAILNFVKNGGGLFMISDHNISDRNNDGKDSPAIWNDFMQNNTVQTNPFGFTVELTNFSQTSTNILSNSSTNPILNGSLGKVTQLKFNNGASIKINKTANTSATGLIWQNSVSQTSTTKIMCASATYFSGRVVLISDSSPADDGTAKPGKNVFPGWTDVSGNHARLHMNASLWLAKL